MKKIFRLCSLGLIFVILLNSCTSYTALYKKKTTLNNGIVVIKHPKIKIKSKKVITYRDYSDHFHASLKNVINTDKIYHENILKEWLINYNSNNVGFRIIDLHKTNSLEYDLIYLIPDSINEESFLIKNLEDFKFYLKSFKNRQYEEKVLLKSFDFIKATTTYVSILKNTELNVSVSFRYEFEKKILENLNSFENFFYFCDNLILSNVIKKMAANKGFELITSFENLENYYKAFGNTKYDNSLFDKFYKKIGIVELNKLISWYPQASNILDAERIYINMQTNYNNMILTSKKYPNAFTNSELEEKIAYKVFTEKGWIDFLDKYMSQFPNANHVRFIKEFSLVNHYDSSKKLKIYNFLFNILDSKSAKELVLDYAEKAVDSRLTMVQFLSDFPKNKLTSKIEAKLYKYNMKELKKYVTNRNISKKDVNFFIKNLYSNNYLDLDNYIQLEKKNKSYKNVIRNYCLEIHKFNFLDIIDYSSVIKSKKNKLKLAKILEDILDEKFMKCSELYEYSNLYEEISYWENEFPNYLYNVMITYKNKISEYRKERIANMYSGYGRADAFTLDPDRWAYVKFELISHDFNACDYYYDVVDIIKNSYFERFLTNIGIKDIKYSGATSKRILIVGKWGWPHLIGDDLLSWKNVVFSRVEKLHEKIGGSLELKLYLYGEGSSKSKVKDNTSKSKYATNSNYTAKKKRFIPELKHYSKGWGDPERWKFSYKGKINGVKNWNKGSKPYGIFGGTNFLMNYSTFDEALKDAFEEVGYKGNKYILNGVKYKLK